MPSVQNVFRVMSVVSLSVPRSRIGRQNSRTPRMAVCPMLRCSCNSLELQSPFLVMERKNLRLVR